MSSILLLSVSVCVVNDGGTRMSSFLFGVGSCFFFVLFIDRAPSDAREYS